jgi:hypothetical protein
LETISGGGGGTDRGGGAGKGGCNGSGCGCGAWKNTVTSNKPKLFIANAVKNTIAMALRRRLHPMM